MGIGKRIKEARENLGLTQSELGELVGVTGSAITNYEKETSHPKEPVMYRLFDALHVDANYLFQDVVNVPPKKNDVTMAEYGHIEKYRVLDTHGKEMVDFTLEKEYERSVATAEADNPQPSAMEVSAPYHIETLAAHASKEQTPEGIANDIALIRKRKRELENQKKGE